MVSEAQHPALPRALRRRLGKNRVWRRWAAGWPGGAVLGVLNGVARDLLYKDRLGDLTAHRVSTGTLIALLAPYFWILERRWPIPSLRSALAIGGTWLVLTVLFESGFGHYVDGKSWSELFENYSLAEGRVWIAALVWIAAGPIAIRTLRQRHGTRPSW